MLTDTVDINGSLVEFSYKNEADLLSQVQAASQQMMLNTKPEFSIGQAALEAGTRGATLGGTDYILPLLGGLYAKAFGGEAIRDIPLEQLVTQGQQQVTGRRDQFREESPVTAYGLEIAGSLPTGAGLFKGAQAVAQPLGRMATPAALSATGALEAGGLAEEGEGLEAAAFGAAFAPVAPALMRQVGRAVKTTGEGTAKILGKLMRVNPIATREFIQEGVPQTVMTLSDRPAVQRLSSVVRGTFGSVGRIQKSIDDTLDGLQAAIERKTMTSDKGLVSPQQAGETIQRGVTGYIDRFQQVSSKLYGRVGRFIPDTSTSPLSNVGNFVRGELAQFANEPNLQSRISANKALQLATSAIEDAGQGGLRYGALRRYRTEVGNLIKQNVISGEDNALAKRVYSALTNDMEDVARANGDKALRAFRNANAFYQQGIEQIENKLSQYIKTNADPGKLVGLLKTANKNSDFKLRAIMKAIPKDDQPLIRDAIMQQLGKNNRGDFSVAQYIRDYNQISREAKDALFGASGDYRKSLDRIFNIAKRMDESGRFANVSRTADNLTNVGLFGLGMFNPGKAAVGVASSNLAARLLTNERFARFLAAQSNKPVTQRNFKQMLKGLSQMAADDLSMENDIMTYIGLLGASTSGLIGE